MEMETLVRYNLPAKIVKATISGIGSGMPEIPDDPMMKLKPNASIWHVSDKTWKISVEKVSLSKIQTESRCQSGHAPIALVNT